eukprot:tig00000241_g20992.t1
MSLLSAPAIPAPAPLHVSKLETAWEETRGGDLIGSVAIAQAELEEDFGLVQRLDALPLAKGCPAAALRATAAGADTCPFLTSIKAFETLKTSLHSANTSPATSAESCPFLHALRAEEPAAKALVSAVKSACKPSAKSAAPTVFLAASKDSIGDKILDTPTSTLSYVPAPTFGPAHGAAPGWSSGPRKALDALRSLFTGRFSSDHNEGQFNCGTCHGSGHCACRHCAGLGVAVDVGGGLMSGEIFTECAGCGGAGRVRCPACRP